MAFRALLFSKNPDTNAAMTAACNNAGIRVEACPDIFTAIEKGKKQAFSCVIADWAEQPEASFLLKRARESAANRDTLAIAVVDRDPTHAELRDNHLDFLIYRPIAAAEADAVLAKACEQMQPASPDDAAEPVEAGRYADNPPAASFGAYQPEPSQQVQTLSYEEDDAAEDCGGIANYAEEPRPRSHAKVLRGTCVALLWLAAALCLWRSHEIFGYLSQTPEGGFRVLRESVAAVFDRTQTSALHTTSGGSDPQPGADFNRNPASSNAQTPALGVIAGASTLAETAIPLRKAPDFPLPVPVLEHRDAPPIRQQRAAIPESVRNSAPIAPPLVVTVTPAQMMPMSVPAVQLQSAVQQLGEPVAVSEEAERALLLHTVNPVYPAEALAKKLHGPVVLQARVGRDGSVEDLKIVRGYFVLAQAAIAAVKQWRFRPYIVNGHAAATQTVITVNFSYPPG